MKGNTNMNEQNKISVLLIQPDKYPKLIEIDNELEAMQRVVGGNIEEYMPFEDDVAIVCNEEGKVLGLPLNRAIYSEPNDVEMEYHEMVSRFREAESNGNHLVGYVIFTEDSFEEKYPIESRTYVISSNNKAFQPGMGGYSIYASSLDGSDKLVRLERYMADEHGGKEGWKIEKCYMKEDGNREMLDIVAGDFFICYAPINSEKFLNLPENLADKYAERFKYPERFFRNETGIVAVPFKPQRDDRER